ncbi:MAG: phosphoribosyltransferase family protein [Flavobacteriales bacterium]
MTEEKTRILTADKVNQMINRLAHQINENCHHEDEVYLVGIAKRGYILAERIHEILAKVAENKTHLLRLRIHKDDPLNNPAELQGEIKTLEGKTVVIIDDVLNSGKTLMYGINHILGSSCKSIYTAVLVDRQHRRFPVKADFVGLTLATTLKEHVEVRFEDDKIEAYLD